jgi:hypothetical protein
MPQIRSRLLIIALLSPAVAYASPALQGDWRLVRLQPAPWIAEGEPLPPASLQPGLRLRFEPEALRGPGVLDCTGARYEALSIPAEGLFQGGLSAPRSQAEALGLNPSPVPSLRLDCDAGSFDFHRADADTLLLALDNRILSFSRSAGALAPDGSPEAAVQGLLEAHYAGDMGFTPAAWAGKRGQLTRDLQAAMDGWFAAEWPSDEPPPINGDPLTDSQEYPTRFAVRAAWVEGESARVAVDLADAWRSRRLDFLLRQEDGAWRLADLVYPDGSRFSQALAGRPE